MTTQTLLVVPTAAGVGLTSACLGLLRSLDALGMKAGYYKPFVQNELNGSSGKDRSSALVARALQLDDVPAAFTQSHVERMLGDNQLDEVMQNVVARFSSLSEAGYDVVVAEGIVPTAKSSYAAAVNLALAQALDARVVIVSAADHDQPDVLADRLEMHARTFGGMESGRTLGCILTRVKQPDSNSGKPPSSTKALVPGAAYAPPRPEWLHAIQNHSGRMGTDNFAILGRIPFSDTLSVPRTRDIAEALGAEWIHEGEAASRRILRTSLTARTIPYAISVFTRGTLIVTPADRADLIATAALCSMNGTPLAGLLLTGDSEPSPAVLKLCEQAFETGLPVMRVHSNSYNTVTTMSHLSNEIPEDDLDRAERVTRYMAGHMNLPWLKEHFSKDRIAHLSPSAFRHQLVQKARAARQRIVLPEGAEPRTIEAACICQERGIAQCVLLAPREEIERVAASRDISLHPELEIIEPTDAVRRPYIAPMIERRNGKITEPLARSQLQDTVVLGTMMLHLGEVDGLVSGAVHTTANTVRPAFQLIKTAPGFSLASSIFFMLLPEQVVVYGDCAINPDPSAEELAEIALQSAKSAQAFGIEPRVAMISYSTGSSGQGAEVDKVREATAIARERAPELLIDGPMQYDAAAVASVGRKKAPDSNVAGRATVFIFPDLNTGNTTYKAVQRSANVVSVGPMLQGLNKPVNDLSRGALVDDIVYTIALTAIQAAAV